MKRMKKYFEDANDFQKAAIIFSIGILVFFNVTLLKSIGEQRNAYTIDIDMVIFGICLIVGLWALGFISGYRSDDY